MSAIGQGLFRREYEVELEQWLQRRFGWLCVVFAAFELIHLTVVAIGLAVRHLEHQPATVASWSGLGGAIAGMAIVSGFLLVHLRQRASRERLLRGAALMVLALGGLTLVEATLLPLAATDGGINVISRFFLWHLTACLILPWRPLESLRPMVPLMLAWAGVKIVSQWADDPVSVVIQLTLAPSILLPGLAVAAIRLRLHGARFRTEQLGRHFLRMRRELRHARSVHESMFPKPYDDGFVRMDYTYAPALDVGGDFVHLHVSPTGTATVTIIDVTGHGIAAALTVNRLHGELERLRAEEPRITPVQLMRSLNRYVHLTLARHNVYGTAVCFEVDPHVGRLRFANAGHPPLLVHRTDGHVESLDSTGFMLGAVGDDEYECEEHDVELNVGDSVVAVTDGAFEGFDRDGRQLGLDALATALRGTPPSPECTRRLAALVERHEGGQSQDDVLVAVLSLTAVRARATRDAVAVRA